MKRYRLALAGHVSRHEEPAGKLFLWLSETKCCVGRPCVIIKTLVEKKDTGLSGLELLAARKQHESWYKNIVNVSPSAEG